MGAASPIKKLPGKKHPSPHDSFIKSLFKNAQAVRDLPTLLPGKLAAMFAPGSVKLDPGSYIDERLAASHSDLLFSCELQSKASLLYLLFEHQTKVDPKMPLRTTGYLFGIINDWAKAHPRRKTIPPVMAIVFHQGKKRWNAPTRLLDLTEIDPSLKSELGPLLLSSGFVLVDLKDLDIENLRSGLLLKLGLGLMKAVALGRSFEWLEQNTSRLDELISEDNGPSLLRLILTYAFQANPEANPSTINELAARINQRKVRSEMRSVADALHDEGRKKGWQEGALIGKIQLCESLLGKKQSPTEKLVTKPLAKLEEQLKVLLQRLRPLSQDQ